MNHELTPELINAVLSNKRVVKELRFYTSILLLMGEQFGERTLTEAEHTAFRHHLDELRKWWESAKEVDGD